MKVDLDRSGAVDEPTDVEAVQRRLVRWFAVSDFSQPPEAIMGLVPERSAFRQGRGGELLEPEVTGSDRETRSEDKTAFGPRRLALGGVDALLMVSRRHFLDFVILFRCAAPVAGDVGSEVL